MGRWLCTRLLRPSHRLSASSLVSAPAGRLGYPAAVSEGGDAMRKVGGGGGGPRRERETQKGRGGRWG